VTRARAMHGCGQAVAAFPARRCWWAWSPGLGAVAFRYLIYFFTWLATGHIEFVACPPAGLRRHSPCRCWA